MKVRHLAVGMILSNVVLVSVVDAAQFFSPLLNALSSGRQFRCSLLNIGTTTRQVTFEIITNSGTIAGPTARTIEPGKSSSVGAANTSEFAYCKVQTDAAKSNFRGHFAIEVIYSGGDTEMVLSVPLE